MLYLRWYISQYIYSFNNLIMDHLKIAADNYVAFTFFIGTMAMMAASVFFFFELSTTPTKYRSTPDRKSVV